jgi:glutathione S-transferase
MDGREFIVGKRFTIADIILFVALDFGRTMNQPLDPKLRRLGAWFERVKARPSVAAVAH